MEPSDSQNGRWNWWKNNPIRIIGGSVATIIATVWVLLQIYDHAHKNNPAPQIAPIVLVSSTGNQPERLSVYSEHKPNESESTSSNSDVIIATNKPSPIHYLYCIYNDTGYPSVTFHVKTDDEISPAIRVWTNDPYYFATFIPAAIIHFNPSVNWQQDDKEISINGFPCTGEYTNCVWTNAFVYSFQIVENGQIDLFPCECNSEKK